MHHPKALAQLPDFIKVCQKSKVAFQFQVRGIDADAVLLVPRPCYQLTLRLVATEKNGLHMNIIKLRDRNVVRGASEVDIEEMISELQHERHDELHCRYLDHARATIEVAQQRHAQNSFAIVPVAPKEFPSLLQAHGGAGRLPTRGYLSTVVDKFWEVRTLITRISQNIC